MATILFVEDDALVRHGLARVLAAAGHEVRACGTVADAIVEAGRFDPELLLLDIGLPDADGLQCAKELRERGFDGALVFLTAGNEPETVRQAIAQGAHTYLVKPITGAQLVPVVQATLASATSARERQDKFVTALRDSREISSAVGAIAQREGCSLEAAFESLRRQARSSGRKVAQVAAETLADLQQSHKGTSSAVGKSPRMH